MCLKSSQTRSGTRTRGWSYEKTHQYQEAHHSQYPVCVHRPARHKGRTRLAAGRGRRFFRYSKKYLAEHESDIIIHKASKKAFDELGLKKLPTVKNLQAEYAELLAGKKEAYAEYHSAQKEMRELLIHRQNIVQFLNLDMPAVQKEKEHDRG
ncbi:MAG: hypothetical protein PHE47_02860 [Oscillospiraceae bacterium]|nr:hypothetical protein [Oscillospiraceae bacterium]